jgi:outer membrane protein
MIPGAIVLIRYLGVFIEKNLADCRASFNIASLNPDVMKKTLFSLLCIAICSFTLHAQDVWTLERCIREALDKNLNIEQIKLNKLGYDVNGKQLRRERIPSLNVSSDFGFTVGRVVNPATNDFETENSLYQSIGVGTGLTLYNGGRINKSVRQNDFYVDAAEKDIQQAEEDLALSVALSYLNLLFAYENEEIAQARVQLTKDQLSNLDKMIAAGTRPENDRYDILSQLAVDEQSLITATNNIETNLLALKQHMFMEPDSQIVIERPVIDVSRLEPLENQPFEIVYETALSNQAQIKAAELRQEATELAVDIARSARIPTLSIGGNLGTNWSNLGKAPASYVTQRITQPGVYIDGNPAVFQVDQLIPTSYENIDYVKQLDQNLGYGWGASLSIPILNNYAGQASVERAKINVINADIETEKIKQTLKTNVQNALASAKAAKKALEGAEVSAQAAQIALDNADRRAALGSISNFDYLSARNRKDAADNNLLIARYDYYFQIQVIEYYLGRGIRLE